MLRFLSVNSGYFFIISDVVFIGINSKIVRYLWTKIKEKNLQYKDKDKFFTKNRNITKINFVINNSLKTKNYANLNSEKEPDYGFIF
ncbi:hypothetical protein BpHYR1_006837 [Brachionus plicatilis]|uniref:Uncharacterized protein n=1 Tax=Brachionus plicatilis TaxID=10195 RepID=A0A3M7PII1_BRAPC|nr:hypothetical protein BpHYR1_006837 [Brachionus plicatilis]